MKSCGFCLIANFPQRHGTPKPAAPLPVIRLEPEQVRVAWLEPGSCTPHRVRDYRGATVSIGKRFDLSGADARPPRARH